ncbi:MAG: acyl-CoA dehydrogenase family protein [Alphaproteobacteria bacterium]
MSAQATAPETVAPDTQGQNFYQQDRSLADLLRLYLEPALYDHLQPHLRHMGWLAANEMDEWGRLADRHPPVLHPRDRFGRDVQRIEYHPAYRELEAMAFGLFGMHAMSHRGGVLGWPHPYPAVAKHAFTYLFNQAEFGLGCPINVTDSGILLLRRYGDEALQKRFLSRMLSQEMARLWQGAQFMTEKEGGSDVGRATTRAEPDGEGNWRITGEKWFCSNADAPVAQLLARPVEAGPGTRGLGLFVMPRWLADGSPNRYRIVRLKDKLGSRSMASGEIVMEGALAYAVGRLDRGFVQMADMVNWSRLSNGVKSTAIMRRAAHDALTVARSRIAFGHRLIDLPLARRQLLKILLPTEAALSVCMLTADALDKAEDSSADRSGGSQAAAALLRVLTPVLKYRATRDARKVAGDAMEMRGGTGYVEEFVTPRLLRDAHLGSIWEGAGNVVALDAIARAVGRHHGHEILRETILKKLEEAEGAPPALVARMRDLAERAVDFAVSVATHGEREADARRATSALYNVTAAASMVWEGARLAELTGDARRLLWARLLVDHRLTSRDPLAAQDTAWEDRAATLLLADAPAPMEAVAPLLG